ncbi:protein PHOX [Marchantia polymorpha subsp. ruderalis]
MGKSSGKKKKANSASGEGATKVDPDDAVFLKRAHELKDEGNRRFQAKDYMGALDNYDQALKLTPEGHPDRAVFHSNRAACLLQVKPVIYDNVIMECTLALEAHPKFGKALYRRARAYEAMGKLQLALADVQFLLQSESSNQEALELGKRLRAALGNIEGAQQDTQWRSSVSLHASPPDTATSPATPGADGAPGQSGRGPTLPARPPGKKKGRTTTDSEATLRTAGETGTSVPSVTHNTPQPEMSKSGGSKVASNNPVNRDEKKLSNRSISREEAAKHTPRLLKLVFGHDIRRAEVFGNCGFGDLREVVRKRFPGLKTVLIKYQDPDGDLVTITSREELRLAEAAADEAGRSKKLDAGDTPVPDASEKQVPLPIPTSVPELVRLYLVECTPEQEPPIPEDDEIVILEEDDVVESLGEDMVTESLEVLPDSEKDVTLPEDGQVAEAKTSKSAKKEDGQPAGEEMEIDDWLFDFAQLFRSHVGIDPDGHVDFHELGMELCSEALEAAVTSDEAQPLFEAAAAKFQEVAALALFNWGNVYMCAARKRMPMEEAGGKPESKDQLQAAFEWAESHYKLAGQKYEEALRIKPDFYEGVLALGQEKFESAKLQWAAAVAGGVDLKSWDSSETLSLYRFAEERMQTAAEMWEQLEAQQQGAEATSKVRKEQVKPETSNDDGASASEAADQGAAMRSQINLFWGNVLFEHSQVEYRLGLNTWRSLLDVAVEKFVAAGASAEEIEGALKNHPANLAKEKTENSLPLDEPSTSVVDKNGNSPDPVNENGLLKADEDPKANKSTVTSSAVQIEPKIIGGDAPGIVAKDTENQTKEDLPETASVDREDGQGNGRDGPSSKAICDDGLVDTPLEDSTTKSSKKGANSSAASGSHKASTEDKPRPKRAEKKRSQGS